MKRCPMSPTEDHVPCLENCFISWSSHPDSIYLNGQTFRHAVCCHCLVCYVIPRVVADMIERDARARGIANQGPRT